MGVTRSVNASRSISRGSSSICCSDIPQKPVALSTANRYRLKQFSSEGRCADLPNPNSRSDLHCAIVFRKPNWYTAARKLF